MLSRREKYGRNSTEVEKVSVLNMVRDEVLSPFFMFQVASCLLWFLDNYVLYASLIMATSILSMAITLHEQLAQQNKISAMSRFTSQETVLRRSPSGEKVRQTVPSDQLVVGDLLEIQGNRVVPCDLVLLNGACIVNESILTGESIPVVKNPMEE